MDLDKQHAVLEVIFEYLLASGRKDLVDAYKNASQMKSLEKVCTARKNWKCCKCRQQIAKGSKYFCITVTQRSSFNSTRYCLSCADKLDKPLMISKKQTKMKFLTKE